MMSSFEQLTLIDLRDDRLTLRLAVATMVPCWFIARQVSSVLAKKIIITVPVYVYTVGTGTKKCGHSCTGTRTLTQKE